MRKLLNTLFVTTEDAYLALDGENIVVQREADELLRLPLHTLESVLYFGYKGASPALMGACAQRNIAFHFYTPSGRYLAGVHGETRGNVALRQAQYTANRSECDSAKIAGEFLIGKIYNARWVLERATRDHAARVDAAQLKQTSQILQGILGQIPSCASLDSLRGLEGDAAMRYFGVFNQLILNNQQTFAFHGRSRRPPLDPINAMLSFAYSLLANDCEAALEGVGLDPYVGFLHRDRPGRASLALDLMEELRAAYADRFVLSLINTRAIQPSGFEKKENGAVFMSAAARKIFLSAWQERKREQITHPFLEEKISWGLVPHVQALLLARYLRGDLDGYPPFLWK